VLAASWKVIVILSLIVQRFFGVVKVADVVFCRVFRAFAVEVFKQQVFDGSGVGAGVQDGGLVPGGAGGGGL